jgi:Lrp/AsnC family transcriptional regulator, regulator for asnA, asnC and gidA
MQTRGATVRQGAAPHGAVKLDDLDRHIMRFLRHDGRLSYAHIAREVGVSEPTVRKRVDRLLNTGAIYIVARVNPTAIGFAIDANIGVRVAAGKVKQVGAKLVEMEHVAYVGYITGSFDILIEAFLPDTEGLFKFLNEDLEAIDGITYTETWHVLRTEKFNYMWEGENVGREVLELPEAPCPRTEGSKGSGSRRVRRDASAPSSRAGRSRSGEE